MLLLLPAVLGCLDSLVFTGNGFSPSLHTQQGPFPAPGHQHRLGDCRQGPHIVKPQLQRQRRDRAVSRGTCLSRELLTQLLCHPIPQSPWLFPPVPGSSLVPAPEPQGICSKCRVSL